MGHQSDWIQEQVQSLCSPGRRRRGGSAQALRPLGRGVSGKEWLKLSIPLPRNPPLEPTCKGNAERPSESDHGSAGDLMPVTPLSRMSDKHSRPEALRPHPREWVCPCVSASKSPQLPTRNMSLQTDTSRLASDGVDGALHKHGRSPQSRVAFERQHAGANNAVVLAPTLTARANPLISHNSSDRRRGRCYVAPGMARLPPGTNCIHPHGTKVRRRVLIPLDFVRCRQIGTQDEQCVTDSFRSSR